MRTEIVFEDRDVAVIYKPAGLATQTAKVGQADAVSELKNHLAGQKQGVPYLGVVHRLDQPVEGLLVFAKSRKAAAALTAQLGDTGLLNKQYCAVVCGKPAKEQGRLVDKMYKDAAGRAVIVEEGKASGDSAGPEPLRQQAAEAKAAKQAILHYRQLAVAGSPDSPLTLLDISIETGRFHQIRAQLAHEGLPILGDGKYGDERALAIARQLGIRSVALCAYSLQFLHPVTGEKKCFRVAPRGAAFSGFLPSEEKAPEEKATEWQKSILTNKTTSGSL